MTHQKQILACAVACALALAGAATADTLAAGQWDEATVETFRTLPIQDGGRIKPLDTYASFLLLQLNGKRTFSQELADGVELKLDPMEWFLDVLFYPQVAKDYRHFVVDNADVVTSLGAERHDSQRDRFSYNELLPARQKLFERAQEAFQIDEADRSSAQSMLLALEIAVQQFEAVSSYFDFAREPFNFSESRLADRIFPDADAEAMRLVDVLEHGRDVRLAIVALQQVLQEPDGEEKVGAEVDAFSEFMRPMDIASRRATALAIIPPADPDVEEWLSVGGLVDKTFEIEEHAESELAVLAAIEHLHAALGQPLQFKQALNELHRIVVEQAKARGEYAKVPLEVSFYKMKFFSYAQVFFILSFLVAALSWLNLRSKLLSWATAISVFVPWTLLVAGIVYRCIIRGRPPVTTLYETILFITAVAVVVAMFLEYVNRQRIAISVAAFLGALGMFLANRYEIVNKEDTMPVLVAVLDTNFWLATHVIIINIGYAAGMLAAGIAHVYILGRLLGLKRTDPGFFRSLTRMVYGVTCFGLLFAFVGTVLGGIWANYSWGRFWGWDPKENGAALICLCMLAMLHARMGGYIRQMGLHLAAVFTGSVVAFSWWGVNLLGVGLHSYGFTSGIWTATYIFWATQGLVILLGFIVLLRDRFERDTPHPAQSVPADDRDTIAAK